MTVPALLVEGLTISFPSGWIAGKFDDWKFYKEHFSRVQDGLKAMDIVAVCPGKVAYLIEFKDYRGRKRAKSVTIETEFIGKTLSTLSALLPAGCNARDETEKTLAIRALSATRIRLVLHLDQGRPGNKLFPPVADRADLTQRLRTRLRSVDPHLQVCSSDAMAGLPWTVTLRAQE